MTAWTANCTGSCAMGDRPADRNWATGLLNLVQAPFSIPFQKTILLAPEVVVKDFIRVGSQLHEIAM
jgi:hypothetical protein